MKRALTLLAAMLMLATVAFADDAAAGAKSLSVHTYSFKYKDAEKAAAMIKLLLSAEGSMSIQPSTNALVDELRDIAPKLGMLRFNSLEDLGSADVAGREGDPGIVTLPSGYRADFKFGDYDPASDSLKISDFHLSKQQSDQLTSLLKTTLNLRIGQTYIVGATKAPQSQRALMIVLVARK